jgi:hypothetical protein
MEDQTIRTYNARDTVVLHQVLPDMLEHLENNGCLKTYREVSIPLIKPLLRMSQRGLLVDQKKLSKKKALFLKTAEEAEKKIFDICGLPEGFNLGSGAQLRKLIWADEPAALKKWIAEKEAIDNDPKRKKTTKKYLKLVKEIAVYENIRPLYRPPGFGIRRTDSGALSVDNETLVVLQGACYRRVEAIAGLVKPTEKHEQEKREIQKVLAFIEEYRKYSDAAKLASTFSGFPIGPDGRVHPSYKIHGTATGRLSSADPRYSWGLTA